MSKVHLFFTRSLCLFIISLIIVSCNEASEPIPYVPIAKVSGYEKDSVRAHMRYGNLGLSTYDMYINDSHVSSSDVKYSPGSIYCVINGIAYSIKLSNSRGGVRAESVNATTTEGSRLFYVEYWYDSLGRLDMARVDGVAEKPAYCHYSYEANSIIIDDFGTEYKLDLSSEENIGYVCNVIDYSGAPLTSTYIINPNLYFLNIYGTPSEKLPKGHTVTRSGSGDNMRLSRVGRYYYEYSSH